MSASSESSAFGEVSQIGAAALLAPLCPYGNLTSIIYLSTCRVISKTRILTCHWRWPDRICYFALACWGETGLCVVNNFYILLGTLLDLLHYTKSAFVLVGLPQTVACVVFFAPPLLNNRNTVLPQLSVLDEIKHVTPATKFIPSSNTWVQFYCACFSTLVQLDLSKVSVPYSHASI